jgi:hypothetical protein
LRSGGPCGVAGGLLSDLLLNRDKSDERCRGSERSDGRMVFGSSEGDCGVHIPEMMLLFGWLGALIWLVY